MTQPLPSTRAGTTDLPEPNLPAVLTLLADENGAFTVPLNAQGAELEMQVLGWADYEASYAQLVSEGYTDLQMIFRCLWEGAAVAEFPVKMEPRAVDFFPVQLQIPAHLLNREGVWSVGYSAEVEVIGNPSMSSSIQIRIDRTAPNFGNPAPLRNDNVRLVDPTYLANNAQQAIFFLDRWVDIRLGDRALIFVIPQGQAATPETPTVEVEVTPENINLQPFPIAVPAGLLRDGQFRVVSKLLDRSGNVGRESTSRDVEIRLTVGPVLPAPVVPLASDGLIDLQEARGLVTVEVPQITQALAGDSIQVYWNDRPLALWPVPATPQWPATVIVPWATITADGFVGPVLRSVRYELVQNAGRSPSPVIQVNVDLRVAGPDPQGPGEVNPQLAPVVVRGRTADNVLGLADVGLAVMVDVELYPNPRAGEVLELHWGNLPQVVATYQVTGNKPPPQRVTFSPVPYEVIRQGGDGPAVQVFYRTAIGGNRQRANPTSVRVDTAQLTRLTVTRPRLTPFQPILNCATQPWLGITMTVAQHADIQVRDRLELRWQLFRTQSDGVASQPLMPAPEYLAPIVVTQAGAQTLQMNEFNRLIFDVFAAAGRVYTGYARIGYRLTKPDGRTVEAPLSWVPIDLQRASFVVCTPTGDVRV